MPRSVRSFALALLAVIFACYAPSISSAETPRLVKKDGRYALMVDGQPFLILGAQINNSSAWPAVLPQVWPAIEAIHANTVEAPVYWEQLESQPGRFDFSVVDELVKQARSHHVYLVLLWFGTWKNGRMHYIPEWIKTDPAQYPRVMNDRGEPLDVLSPHADANLDADKKAFAALMQHLKQIDGEQHTVLLVQVENESGSLGSVRDFSPAAEKLFQSQVPGDLVQALHRHPGKLERSFWRGCG
jgi:beta-galactosidase GanA